MTDEEHTERREIDPRPEPDEEPSDHHRGPLDNDEDGRFLDRDDPRRQAAEERRGHPFDDDEHEDPRRGGLLGKAERLLHHDDKEDGT